MQLPSFLIERLLVVHAQAVATPYFHLQGYMLRDWVFGARSPERNNDMPGWQPSKCSALYRLAARNVAIRAHTILRSDHDRHRHDHPSWSVSIVLQGGYWEVLEHEAEVLMPALHGQLLAQIAELRTCEPSELMQRQAAALGIHWRGPGAVVFRSARTTHRLILPKGMHTKSIFVLGPKTNPWGFITPKGKIPWKEYLRSYEQEQKRFMSSPASPGVTADAAHSARAPSGAEFFHSANQIGDVDYDLAQR